MSEHELTLEKIMERIKSSLQNAQKDREVLKSKPISNVEKISYSNDFIHHLSQLNIEIEQANRKWSVDPEYHVVSHRPRLGRFIVFGKKFIRKFLRWYINPVFKNQRDFNGSVTRSLNSVLRILPNLVSNIDKMKTVIDELQIENNRMRDEMFELHEKLTSYELQNLESKSLDIIHKDNQDLMAQLKVSVIDLFNLQQQDFELKYLDVIKQLEVSILRASEEKTHEVVNLKILGVINPHMEQIGQKLNENFQSFLHELEDKLSERIETVEDMSILANSRIKRISKKSEAYKSSHTEESEVSSQGINVSNNTSRKTEIDYFLFEQKFRGRREKIIERQAFYLPYFSKCSNVLDIGCGRGEFIELLTANHIKVKGIDLNQDMVEYCKERGFQVEYADAIEYLRQIPDNSLDGIFMAQVIEHLTTEQSLELLESIYRVLSPTGIIIVETINVQSVYAMSNWYYMDPTHVKPVHPASLEFIIQGIGFSNVKVEYLSPVPDKRIPRLEINGTDTENFNRSIQELNGFLYGNQDYAVIAKK